MEGGRWDWRGWEEERREEGLETNVGMYDIQIEWNMYFGALILKASKA